MTTASDHPEVDAILELFDGTHADEPGLPDEGLRERKKRQVRQRISDVATAMFLVHGFDDVTVAQIAAAAEVSEQTVFNYFATKESMFFDRTGPMIDAVAEAVRVRRGMPLIDAVVQAVAHEIHPSRLKTLDDTTQLQLIRRFRDVATDSPTLVAARFSDLPRFIDDVSSALAHRIGSDPIDPEVKLATFVIAGLVEVRIRSAFHHVDHVASFAALNDAIERDFLQAARLAEPLLTALDAGRPAGPVTG